MHGLAPFLLASNSRQLPLLLALRGGATATAAAASAAANRLTPERVQAMHAFVVSCIYFVGTMMSSLSGCISAGTKSMDILGCVVVGCITAIGGGARWGGWHRCAEDELAMQPPPEASLLMKMLLFLPYPILPGSDAVPCVQ